MISISDETNQEKIEHKSRKNMALGSIFGYIAVAISILHGFALTPVIIRMLGKSAYGLSQLATSVISLFLLDFGLSTTTNTYLAKLRAKGDKEGVQRHLSAIFKIYLTIDVAIFLIVGGLYFLTPVIYKDSTYTETELKTLQYLFLIVGGYSLISFPSATFSGVISAYEKFSFNKIADIIQKSLYFLLTILALRLDWGIIGIAIVNAGSGIVAVVSRALYMRFYLNIKLDLRKRISKKELKSVFVFSIWGLVLAICSRLAVTVAPAILGRMSTKDEVAIFAIAQTIEGYIFTFGAIMGSTFLLAKIARVQTEGSEEEKRKHLQSVAEKMGKIQFVLIAMIICGFIACGQEFIDWWMDGVAGMHKAYWCIIAICCYEVINIPQLALQGAMFTRGHIKPIAINSIVKAGVNLTLCIWLSYTHGALGASLAIMSARIVDELLNFISYKRYLKISVSHYFKSIYIRGGLTILISLAVGLSLHFLLPFGMEHIKLKFAIIGFSFVVSYIICTFTITFDANERVYYWSALMKLLHIKKKTKPAKVEEKKSEEKPKTEETKNKLNNGKN